MGITSGEERRIKTKSEREKEKGRGNFDARLSQLPVPDSHGLQAAGDRLRTDLEFQPPLDRGLALAFMLGVPKEVDEVLALMRAGGGS